MSGWINTSDVNVGVVFSLRLKTILRAFLLITPMRSSSIVRRRAEILLMRIVGGSSERRDQRIESLNGVVLLINEADNRRPAKHCIFVLFVLAMMVVNVMVLVSMSMGEWRNMPTRCECLCVSVR